MLQPRGVKRPIGGSNGSQLGSILVQYGAFHGVRSPAGHNSVRHPVGRLAHLESQQAVGLFPQQQCRTCLDSRRRPDADTDVLGLDPPPAAQGEHRRRFTTQEVQRRARSSTTCRLRGSGGHLASQPYRPLTEVEPDLDPCSGKALPFRQALVLLHRRQIRSPAHSLSKSTWHLRQGRTLRSWLSGDCVALSVMPVKWARSSSMITPDVAARLTRRSLRFEDLSARAKARRSDEINE